MEKKDLNKQIDEEENLACKTFLLGRKEGIKERLREEIHFLEYINEIMLKATSNDLSLVNLTEGLTFKVVKRTRLLKETLGEIK